jgi:hypothetical protein
MAECEQSGVRSCIGGAGLPACVPGVHLRIGDIGFTLASPDPSLKIEAQGAARHFVVAAGAPDVRIHAAWANGHNPVPGERLFSAGSLWDLCRQDDGYLFRFAAPCFGPLPYKSARFNAAFTEGELFVNGACFPKNQPQYPLEYPLDELLMVNLLARGRGVEVHACGLLDSDGQGYLFLGESGAGKTTTARLWLGRDGVRILSDDRIVLRCIDGRIRMYGTPWHGEGELSSALSAPVARIFFLARGVKNQVSPMRDSDAVARLMACSFVPFYSSEGIEFTLSFLERVARSVPCVEFRFVPDAQAVDFVRNASVSYA